MAVRKIIKIDEDLCTGCGACVPACAEGALQVIGGKARLVSETYCDGLGACLGECPENAISIEERDSGEFDELATRRHLSALHEEHHTACPSARIQTFQPARADVVQGRQPHLSALHEEHHTTCPSARIQTFQPDRVADPGIGPSALVQTPSALGHWPVKLALVGPRAPFLRDADLVLMADCVPVACADVHRDILPGRAVVIGCPKHDDMDAALERLVAIIRYGGIRSLMIAHMEVPCCHGYLHLARRAVSLAGRDLPVTSLEITCRGQQREASAHHG